MEGCTFVPQITEYKPKIKERHMSVTASQPQFSFNPSLADHAQKMKEKGIKPEIMQRKSSTNSMGVFEKLNK